jgi:hypothetical protein
MTSTKEPVKIGNILSVFLRNNTPNAVANWLRIVSIWPKIAGINLAKRVMPLKIAGKILYLTVETSAWMEELKYMKEDILKKINNELQDKAVEDIIFRLGKITYTETTSLQTRRPNYTSLAGNAHTSQLSQKEMDAINSLVVVVKDDGLKETIRRAIIANKCQMPGN